MTKIELETLTSCIVFLRRFLDQTIHPLLKEGSFVAVEYVTYEDREKKGENDPRQRILKVELLYSPGVARSESALLKAWQNIVYYTLISVQEAALDTKVGISALFPVAYALLDGDSGIEHDPEGIDTALSPSDMRYIIAKQSAVYFRLGEAAPGTDQEAIGISDKVDVIDNHLRQWLVKLIAFAETEVVAPYSQIFNTGY